MAPFGRHFLFRGLGFGLYILAFFFVSLDFLLVFLFDFVGFFGVLKREHGHLIYKKLIVAAAYFFGLVVSPLVSRFRLQHNFFGVGAVSEQRYSGDKHRENRHGHRDRREIVLSGLFGMLFEFAKILSHFECTALQIWDFG